MFNELTLALHVLLLVLIYFFLLVTIRVISKDLTLAKETGVAGGTPRIVLLTPEGSVSAVEYPIERQLLIGRSSDCDIVLDDTFASAHHARVYLADSGYWLEDLKSTNGTTVNGKPIKKPVRLTKGTEFKIGQSIFQFVVD
ncbi:MAG: FHA domain-containing protein [Actinomycetota bacterium]|nr:FHA domain-containing protein [Actinomycetota bacterium]